LYEFKLKEDEENIRFQAAIHGAELKEKPQEGSKSGSETVPLFGDPKDYDSMSQEEREKLTKKMMGKHKVWAGQSGLGAKESK
jgi:hypothetical protein